MDCRRREVLEAARKIERERLFPATSKSSTGSTEGEKDEKEGYSSVDESKKQEEEVAATFKGYDGELQPRVIDVVCGRGKAFNRHPGNRKMHDAVTKLKYQYRDSTSQEEKSQIAHTVLRAIQDPGGKFLKYDDSKRQWQELTYKNALKKIYHSIRDSLYNDRSTNLNDQEAEITKRFDKKPKEAKVYRYSESSKDSSNHPLYSKGSGEWNDPRDARREDHGQQMRSQHESQTMFGQIGGNMRNQLSGMVSHDAAQGSPHLFHHESQARATLAAATPLMQQQLMTMGRLPIGGGHQPWSVGPDQSNGRRMSMSEYEAASRAYHDEARGGSQSGGPRPPHPDHHPQYLGMGGMRRY